MQKTVTLQLDSEVVRKAEAIAKRNGETLSHLIEGLITTAGHSPVEVDEDGLTPLIRSLKGSLRSSGVNVEDYRNSLVEKYL